MTQTPCQRSLTLQSTANLGYLHSIEILNAQLLLIIDSKKATVSFKIGYGYSTVGLQFGTVRLLYGTVTVRYGTVTVRNGTVTVR